jgi:hypothetical protein
MRTRPASIATVVIAFGLALTSLGLARSLPYTFGGVGDPSTVGADLWAHGSAVSPPLVALVVLGLLGAIAMRPTTGGRRASAWLAVLAAALLVTGLVEPVQQQLVLFGTFDAALTPLVYAFHSGLVALVLAAVGEVRRPSAPRAGVAVDEAEPAWSAMPGGRASASPA